MEENALFTVIGSRDPIAVSSKMNDDGTRQFVYTEGSMLSIIRKLGIKKAYCFLSKKMTTEKNAMIASNEGKQPKTFAYNKEIVLHECKLSPDSTMMQYLETCHDFDDVKFVFIYNPKETENDIVNTDYCFKTFMLILGVIRKSVAQIIVSSTSGTPQAKDAIYYLASKASNNMKCYSSRNPSEHSAGKQGKRPNRNYDVYFEDTPFASKVEIENNSYMAVVDVYEKIKEYIDKDKFDSALTLFNELDYRKNARLNEAHGKLEKLVNDLSFSDSSINRLISNKGDKDSDYLSMMFLYQEWLMDKKNCNSLLLTLDPIIDVICNRYFRDAANAIIRNKVSEANVSLSKFDIAEYGYSRSIIRLNGSVANRFLKMKYIASELYREPIDDLILKSLARIATIASSLRNNAAHSITSMTKDAIETRLSKNLAGIPQAPMIYAILNCSQEKMTETSSFNELETAVKAKDNPNSSVKRFAIDGKSNKHIFDSIIQDEKILYEYVYKADSTSINTLESIKENIKSLIQ